MEKLKKARVKGSRGSCSNSEENCVESGKCNDSSSDGASEGEEGCLFRAPMNTNGHSCRKRIKLQVSYDYKRVDPALVPRKLRSAINTRPRQSLPPLLSDSKRKNLRTLNGTQLSNGYIAERFRENMLDQVTRDEEEVAEALTTLASVVTLGKPIKNKEECNVEEIKEAPIFGSKASKEDATTVLLPCNGSIGTDRSLGVEESHENVSKDELSIPDQRTSASIGENTGPRTNRTVQPDSRTTLLSNNGKERDGASPIQSLTGNGGMHQNQAGNSSMCRRDIGIWPLGSAPMELDLQSVKQKLESGTKHYISQREAISGTWPGLASNAHSHLTTISSSSSRNTACPKSVTASAKRSSTGNDLPTETLSSIDRKAPYKKCVTHVYISNLIRDYQNAERKPKSSLPPNQSKAKEGTNYALQTANGSAISLPNGFRVEKSSSGHSAQMLHDGRPLQAQLMSPLSGAYGQQKQVGEFLSMSAAADAKNSGNASKSSVQHHVPFFPHHSLMPFPFSQGPYPYQDQLAAASSRQVQLQLPPFVSTGPVYAPQMAHASRGATKQQQQQQMMWQAQMARFRPPVGFPAKWPQQNGQYPLPKDYFPPIAQQHLLLPVPSSSSSSLQSRTRQQQQQHNGVVLNLEAPTQLQMLCNSESFR